MAFCMFGTLCIKQQSRAFRNVSWCLEIREASILVFCVYRLLQWASDFVVLFQWVQNSCFPPSII